MSERSDVVVVVLNWNGWDDTRECLRSLAEMTPRCRVLLVDNGSTDDSIARTRAEFPAVEVLDNGANLGFTEGNNRGITRALAEGAQYVMLLNNDTMVDPGFLAPLLAAFDDDPGLGFASPVILYASEPDAVWFCGGAIDWRTGWAHHRHPPDGRPHDHGRVPTPIATGCCLIAPRRTWEDVGLLDPRYFLFWEDADWTLRATRAGHPGAVIGESRIWHKVSRSFARGEPTLGTFYFVRNGLLFIAKHGPGGRAVVLRFLDEWVLRPSLREAWRRQPGWTKLGLLRASAVLAYVTGRFGAAPGYAARIARRRRGAQRVTGGGLAAGEHLVVSRSAPWARLYLGYERRTPNHPGKRKLLRLLLRGVSRARPQPFAWRMENGALLAISPLEGLSFAWTVGWTCFQTGRWEPHVERCIRQVLRPGDAAIDVGANLGYFTAVMAQCVGDRGEVWAFEPVPPTFDRLRLAVSLNEFVQVTPWAMALGDDHRTAEIAFDPRYAGSASFYGPRSPQTSTHEVSVRRLDDVVTDGMVDRTRLIKIDVEGHELAVIRGARRTIEQAQPRIIFEFTNSLADRGGWTLPEIGDAIAACGDYRFFEIGDDDLRPVPDLATYAPPSGGYGADLLAVPATEVRR